ncbi:MAG TPA: NYN domain-containing protein [Gemmatimonadales bacterium]
MNASQPHTHLPRPAHKEPPAHAPNAALLIDFDNMTMGIRSDLHSELKRLLGSDFIRGKVAVQRAYADWRRYQQYVVPLAESSIDLIFAPAYGSSKKNATDIRLAVDALELVFTRPEIGTFILLSGDSDFSSLVIKLKEYGKYVIGVGIRESSSDLLIQNCDEYYSYNQLAGLTKESDVVLQRHDPWELVVEAVKQMTAHNDVMRSDRLKQVMQEIDPGFDEKDLGFSRFSKFVVEASHKGIVTLTKLDSGQYEISLGPAASGAPRAAPELRRSESAERPAQSDRRRGEKPGVAPAAGFSLGEAFSLLKQAVGRLGGGGQPVPADDVREAMAQIKGDAEPLDPAKFPKLLRQAHDAEIIDLAKEEDGAYAVRLRPEAEPDQGEAPPPAIAQPAAPGPAAAIPSRSARFRKGSKGRAPIAPPNIPKIGVVEVDPNFRPRIDLIPVTPPTAAGPSSPPAPPPPPGAFEPGTDRPRVGDDAERRPRRGRGGRGRGRGGRGPGGEGRPAEQAERERGERAEGSRGGGEGRGRRGRGGRGGRGGERDREHVSEDLPRVEQMEEPRAPMPKPTSDSPAPGDSESFWSRVKRGLIGGE